ncbi:DUF1365 family protein [Desulfosoma sp.]
MEHPLHDQDYLDGRSAPIRPRLEKMLEKQGIAPPFGRILLVTSARHGTRVFHPVSFHYVFDPQGDLKAVVAEMNNTFGEQHLTAFIAFLTDGLEEAQRRKLRCIAHKARLGPNDHVVEIGCGWGSFAVLAARETGCRVTGITVSKAQWNLAQQRVREAGLQDRVTILLQDYRRMQGRFDKIVVLCGVPGEHRGALRPDPARMASSV